jgi:DNA gyrase subunit A
LAQNGLQKNYQKTDNTTHIKTNMEANDPQNPLPSSEDRIIQINIEDQMKTAYIDYSMSVIVSRALPDVRDGLKPVHRRVLYSMHELGLASNKSHKKSARIVGECLGKYHPHGDSSVYDTMVRMAQEWSLRHLMVDGQGNFGSVDGDSPAAMRYTEARLTRYAEEILADLDKDTVDFTPNFDDSLEEPSVMPAKIPNLLVNGASGIAVGMATNMAPHNLGEVIDGTLAYIDNLEITPEEIIKHIKAPDFPTGAIIYGYEGVKDALITGRGRVIMRAKAEIEVLNNGRERIIVTEIPYQVNKADMLVRTAELIGEKKIEGISDIRDESDRTGMRIVYEIKKDAQANVVLNQLYSHTSLQTSFSVNNIALVGGRPQQLNVLDMIRYFVQHRQEVITRRTQYELKEALKRAHLLEGFLVALDELDEVIRLIRAARTPDEAKENLMQKIFNPTESLVLKVMQIENLEVYKLSDAQAKAILEMRLQRLTGLERDKIRNEYAELMQNIAYLKSILDSEALRYEIIKTELTYIKDKFANPRRSTIDYTGGGRFIMEDMIADEDVMITVSHAGYIKRTLLTEYKVQNRGGRGVMGGATRNEDFIEHILPATNHNYLLFFTEQGRCFWLKAYEIPEGAKTAKGRAIQNLINIPADDKVKTFITVNNLKDETYLNNTFIIFCTKQGTIKKTTLEAFSRPRTNGIAAINITEGDELLEVKLTTGNSHVLLAIKSGRAIHFHEQKVRPMGRSATGVNGIDLDDQNDEVIGMITINDHQTQSVLVVSEKGYGKRSDADDYRITNRGGKGVRTLNITEKTGKLIALKAITDQDNLMIIRKDGVVIRIEATDLRIMGRATQGVRLIKIDETQAIASVAVVPREEEEFVEILAADATEITDGTNENTIPSTEPTTETPA